MKTTKSHFFDSRNGYISHFNQVANFWFSSHTFGEVAVIQQFQYYQNDNKVLYGAAVLDDIDVQLLRQNLGLENYKFNKFNYGTCTG